MSNRNLTVVLKASKLCNLRCEYCYEYEHLANPARLHDFTRLFDVLSEIEEAFSSQMKFCWHGGEPLLLPRTFYEDAFEAQSTAFGAPRFNMIQTNLFRLSDEDLSKLKMMDHVSISFDVFGGKRINRQGTDSMHRVVDNMDRLRAEQIEFGAISVLTRKTLKHTGDIFRFFNQAGLSFRLLPYYREGTSPQTSEYAVSVEERNEAMLGLLDLFMQNSSGIKVFPLEDYINVALSVCSGSAGGRHYEKRHRENVLMVDTNGDVYSPGTAFLAEYCYGNLYRDNGQSIVGSTGRMRAIERCESLLQNECAQCEYFGHCSGYFIGEQTNLEQTLGNDYASCVARRCISRILEWFNKSNLAVDCFRHA